MTASVWTLALLAGDRFFGIVYAMKARVTDKKAAPLVSAVWILSFVVSFPRTMMRNLYIRQWKNFTEAWCSEDSDSSFFWNKDVGFGCEDSYSLCIDIKVKTIYSLFLIIFLFYLPLFIMVITYIMAIKRLISSTKSIPNNSLREQYRTLIDARKKVCLLQKTIVFFSN